MTLADAGTDSRDDPMNTPLTDIVVVTEPGAVVVPRWSGRSGPAVVNPSAAVARLPGGPDQDPFVRLARAFIAAYPDNSALAYRLDLRAWQAWCAALAVHPFNARRHHVDAWIRVLSKQPLARTGRPLSPASINRRLSAVSKFYTYGIEVEVLRYSPVAHVRRPRVSEDSSTVGLSATELVRLLAVAERHSPRSGALVTLLAYNGVRIAEALSADVDDYTYQQGHRVLRITRKGGRRSTEPLAPPTVRALDTYIGDRSAGPVFLNRAGTTRLSYTTAAEQLRRLAATAKIPAANSITPHSLRHTFVTEALAAGAPLQDVQDAAGHADPRTTRRYDRSRLDHDQHPTYRLAAHLRRAEADHTASRERT